MSASRTESFFAGAVLAVIIATLAHGQTLGPDAGDRAKICVHGYARSVRPSESIIHEIKRQKAAAQGVDIGCCELNHIYPLCIGGDPLDPANLELQPWSEAHPADEVEIRTCREWCGGEIELPQALARFKRTHP